MYNAMIIDKNDDVAMAIEPIRKGETVSYSVEGETVTLEALDDIVIYHKIALRDISQGVKVRKYGEHFGEASTTIKKGQHVHEHNITSVRENLDC